MRRHSAFSLLTGAPEGALIRPSFISVVYVVFALTSPLLETVSSSAPISRRFRIYFLLVLVASFVFSAAQLSYQIYESFLEPNIDEYTKICNVSVVKFWLRQIGLIRIKRYSGFDTIRVVLPEFLALVTSLVATVCCRLMHQSNDSGTEHCSTNVQPVRRNSSLMVSGKIRITEAMILSLKKLSDFAVILILGLVGILQYTGIQKKRNVKWSLMSQIVGTSLIGFVPVLHTDCNAWWSLSIVSLDYWTALANAISVLVLYHILIMQYSFTRYGIHRKYKTCGSAGSSVHDEIFYFELKFRSPSHHRIFLLLQLLARDANLHNLEILPLRQANASHMDHNIATLFIGCSSTENLTSGHDLDRSGKYTVCCVTEAYVKLYRKFSFELGLSTLETHLQLEACIILVFKNTRIIAFRASPLIMAYVEFLLVAQYICSMDIKHELPQTSYLELIGFVYAANRTLAFITLLAKGLLSLPLFALLRLCLHEKYNHFSGASEQQEQIYDIYAAAGRVIMANNETASSESTSLVVRVIAKYWIFVVSLVLLVISIRTPPVLYTIGFFISFSLLIVLLLSSLGCLRRFLYSYCTFLAIYSSVVVIVLYCYQFPSIPAIWQDATGLDDDWNHDIGLINYKQEGDNGALFSRLIGPISLFVVIMVHLKFFHDLSCPFVTAVPSVRANDVTAGASNAARQQAPALGLENAKQRNFYARMKHFLEYITEVLWSIAEVHIAKLVMFILVVVAINDMHFVVEKPLPVYSEELSCNSSEYALDAAAYWLGFRKVPIIGSYIGGLIVALLALAVQAIVTYRQQHKRLVSRTSASPCGIVFPEADPKNWDASLVDMFKFFFNYVVNDDDGRGSMDTNGFFGNALTYLVIGIRIQLSCNMSMHLACIPSLSCHSLSFTVRVLCYPWSHWLSNPMQNDNLVFWLDLASYRFDLDAGKSVADFLLLLLVACQEYAFRNESSSPAGGNESIYAKGKCRGLKGDNPTYDFIAQQLSCVDFLKIIVFMYGHWITIVMVLVAGLGGVSLFALGYIILAFWILWEGASLYVMPDYRKTLARWNLLLYYTVFVMFCKVALQVFACTFIHVLIDADLCCIRQLFSIVCVNMIPGKANNYYLPIEQQKFDKECTVQKSETQIGFDTLAFGLLILQLRVFNSWYFQHCVVEYRSEAVLMNRGAVLQDQLIEREMIEQKKQQEKKFQNIKIRTEQIRKDYEKRLSKAGAFVPQTYGQGMETPDPDNPSPWYRLSDPRGRSNHQISAKRAGDYYMFEYDPLEDTLDESVGTFVPEVTPGASEFNKLDPAQLMHTAVQHDLNLAETLNAVNLAERIETDEEDRMIKAVSEEIKSQRRLPAQLSISEESKSEGQIMVFLRFVQKLFASALGWFAAFLNRRSREHRYVAYVLGKEKEKLKERLKLPLVDASRPVLDIRQEFNQQNLHCVSSESDIERLEGEVQNLWQQRNVCLRFVSAAGYCIAAHTDVICYLLAIINHARCSGIISLPLPLLIFFWGSLTNPRPTEIFWIIMITYTELIVVIKFIAQFGFFSFNSTANIIRAANSVDYLPGILGIRKTDYYAFWDISLLVALFFHRYMLRRLGLWKEVSDVSKTYVPTLQMSSPGISNLSDRSHTGVESIPFKRMKHFFTMLFNPPVRYIRDLYPFMFLMDVLCFFVVSFGFSSFDYGGTGSVVRDISSNRVPITFVMMLIVISLMIIIDRAFYLRKAVKCKFLYQPAWLNKTAQFLYFIKCIYLLISAWQIRNGYPTLCAGNLITHAYGLSNMIFFKLFMAIPFLFELRTATDWTWADTSMPLFDFFNMENFYAIIYNLKCARTYEKASAVVKYLMGVPVILGLILFIWLPLLSFSLLNRIGIIQPPTNVMLTIGIEGYPSLFKIEAQGIELAFLTNAEYLKLQNAFSDHYTSSDAESILRARHALAFITEYNPESIMERKKYEAYCKEIIGIKYRIQVHEIFCITTKVRFRPESHQPWLISNDALVAMKYELKEGTKRLNAIIRFTYERPNSKHADYPSQHIFTLTIPLPVNSTVRNELAEIVDGQYNHSMLLENAWPPYVIMPNEGNVKPASALLHVISGSNSKVLEAFSDISMKLKTALTTVNKVWSASLIENNETAALTLPLEDVKYETRPEKYMQIVVFVDRVFPSFVSKYVQGGIIAMYVAVVMLVGRMIRGLVTNSGVEVMVSEIPNPDHLLKICLDIYLVREAKDFVLEQDLFGKLIFLFRSPENLIKWTRNRIKVD
uniref:Piezo-type mechanosensitive ion channel component n=1 Tax=Setaria digitata TaxID=48799 RepID=A0A915PYM3_9BILA